MPSNYMKADWILHDGGSGAWTLETQSDSGVQETIIATRAQWPSRAAESLANGHLCKAAPRMYDALQTYMVSREWALRHSGDATSDPEVIRQFAAMQKDLHDEVVAALAEADGTSTQEAAS